MIALRFGSLPMIRGSIAISLPPDGWGGVRFGFLGVLLLGFLGSVESIPLS